MLEKRVMSYESKVAEVSFATVDQLADLAKKLIDEKTPEDTTVLVENNKKKPTRKEGAFIIGEVENTTPYAPYVEYWVQGKTYNYHKPKGQVFHTGVGAGMYARTEVELLEKGENIIIEAFDTLIDELNQWTS